MLHIASQLARRQRNILTCARAHLRNWRDRCTDPAAASFFAALTAGGFNPEAHIDALPEHRLLYVSVPKCASTTIKSVLSALHGRAAVAPTKIHNRRHTGLPSPSHIGISNFYRLVNSPGTLRFAFVRNPYARLVSAWADKFQNKPLVAGDSFIELYLAHRAATDPALPCGPDKTLSFAQFVDFAIATAHSRVDAHWHSQADLLDMPGIALDFVGKVECFGRDFERVLQHVDAGPRLRYAIGVRNGSRHLPWPDYYSDSLAARVYRTYQRDFDSFGYVRQMTLVAAE